jgi:hypothetical protein
VKERTNCSPKIGGLSRLRESNNLESLRNRKDTTLAAVEQVKMRLAKMMPRK